MILDKQLISLEDCIQKLTTEKIQDDFINIVNINAIKNNYLFLRSRHIKGNCSAVVKSNAYGLGAKEIASALNEVGCKDFFVSNLEEGVQLRETLSKNNNIYILYGPTINSLPLFVHYRLIPVLNYYAQVLLWDRFCKKISRKLEAVIQFDTGMHRGGLDPNETQKLYLNFEKISFTIKYLMSHLSCSEIYNHPMNKQQNSDFKKIIQKFNNLPATLANSGGIFQGTEFHHELLRPGAAIYGISPTPHKKNPMLPVLQSFARIIQFHEIKKEQFVGYGLSYKTKRDSRIAMIGVGYAQGYPWGNQKGWCQLNSWKLPIVGNISMNATLVDVTDVPSSEIREGTMVQLIGPHITLEQLSRQTKTISRDLLLRIANAGKKHYHETKINNL